MQVNDLPGVATEVPGTSWLIQPYAPLGTVGVNNLPWIVSCYRVTGFSGIRTRLLNTSQTRYPLGCHATMYSDMQT